MEKVKLIPTRRVSKRPRKSANAGANCDQRRLAAFLKKEAELAAKRPTLKEWLDRVSRNKPIRMKQSAAELIREMRGE